MGPAQVCSRSIWGGVLGICIMASSVPDAHGLERLRVPNPQLTEISRGKVTAATHDLFKLLLTSHRTFLAGIAVSTSKVEMLRYKK